MLHVQSITGNKVSDSLASLNIKTDFVIPAEGEISTYREQSDIYDAQNKAALLLIEKTLIHVRQFDSLSTASKILGLATQKCPSRYSKEIIIKAHSSLRAAIKADKWLNSRKRRRHVDESTVRRNLDTFYQRLAEAASAIKLDLDKTSQSLFTSIKKQYQSDLPLHLPADKKAVKRTAHIIVVAETKPNDNYVITRLEETTFLIENVVVVGVNNKVVDNTLEYAETLTRRSGKTVYNRVVSRPSDNIDWYIVQDFGTKITFASFADRLELHDNGGDGVTFGGYLKQRDEERRVARQFKSNRLKNVREAFVEDNKPLFEDLRHLRTMLENLATERSVIAEEFKSITTVNGDDSGIEVTQHKRLYGVSIAYRDRLVSEGRSFSSANADVIRLRVEAKSFYYMYSEISANMSQLRARIAFINEELENRKTTYARKLGMVSEDTYVHAEDLQL